MEESHKILTCAFLPEKHQKMAEAFARASVTFSINLVTCVGHNDNLIPHHLSLPFEHFVGADLESSHSVYCISDEAWVNDTAKICALYAQTHPARLMIDDDFRSLNHTAPFGCFCATHAKKASEELGYCIAPHQLRDACCEIGENALDPADPSTKALPPICLKLFHAHKKENQPRN